MFQRFQNSWTLRGNDIQNGNGRLNEIWCHLPCICYGIFARQQKQNRLVAFMPNICFLYPISDIAYYIIFLSFDNPLTPEDVDDSATNPISSPVEAIMAMFLMSMTNFGDYYGAFARTEHEYVAKVQYIQFLLFLCTSECIKYKKLFLDEKLQICYLK